MLHQPDESILSDLFVNVTDSEEIFLLFAADNADHQIQSLHGKGTFHGMGIITCVTPSRKVEDVVRRDIESDDDLRKYKMPTETIIY